MLCGKLGQEPCLIDGQGQRLFAIDVLSGCDGLGCDDGVSVVGGGDHHCVSLVKHLVEHHAVVVVALCLRVPVEYVRGVLPVDIAESDDVLRFHLLQVSGTTSSDTYTEDVELVVGCHLLFLVLFPGRRFAGDDDVWSDCKSCSYCRSCLKERAS